MANFCVALKMKPSEFRELTLLEYSELAKAFANSKGQTNLEDLLNG